MLPKRVLITGAAGFIGSNLAHQFCREGWDVIGVDDLSNGHVEFVNSIVLYKTCFSDKTILDQIKADQFQVVVHLAAVPRVGYSVEHPLETNDVNVSKTLELIDACVGHVDRFIFASSSSVYGGADVLPTPPSHQKDPKSPYALQKSIIEDYLVLYRDLYGLDSVALRFFNVFGPNQLGDSPYATAVSSWLNAIKKGEPLRSDGDGTQSRDMCYVDNTVKACILAAEKEEPLNAMRLNVACGDKVTNNEILEYLLKRYPDAVKQDAPWRAGDVMHTLADVSETKDVLGYEPVVGFWNGLEKTIEWFEENWDGIKNMKLNT